MEMLVGHKQNNVCTRTQGKGTVTPLGDLHWQWPASGTGAVAAAVLGGACWHRCF